MPTDRSLPRCGLMCWAVASWAAILPACSTAPGKSGSTLTAGSFAKAGAAPVTVSAERVPLRAPGPGDTIGQIAASDGILDVTAMPGPPGSMSAQAASVTSFAGALERADGLAASPAAAAGVLPQPVAVPGGVKAQSAPTGAESTPTVVDAKVGDINGRPIYANAFLAPMADRLRAEARLKKYEDWKRDARKRIDEELDTQIERELLRAEALASLTPEQKQGFFAFMESVQQKLQSQNQGSREAASKQIEEAEGKSLDEYMKQRQQDELVKFQVGEKIGRRVNVSRRDVELWYQKYYELFNPPPKARYRLVQIPDANAADQTEFARLLAEGKPFADLAAMPLNKYKADTGGLEDRDIKGDRKDAKLFANAELNKAAQTMEPGQTVGPVKLTASKAWLHLDRIETKTRSLYEAQMLIENMLRDQRTKAAKDKYVGHLRERASMTSTADMSRRLLEIAEARFYPDKSYTPPVKAPAK